MTAWQRLGIAPTDNHREIKRAYAKQLKLIDQDTQPEEFIRLREALEIAQFEADHLAYESEDSDDSFHIFEPVDSPIEQNQQPEQLNHQSLQQNFKRIEQHIMLQDINFNIRDELIHFNNELELYQDKDIKQGYITQVLDILKKYDLDDFNYIFSEQSHQIDDSNQHHIMEENEIEPSSSSYEVIENEAISTLAILDEVTDALWNKDISDTTFEKFSYLLKQQFDIPLSQQIQIKDQLQAPLAEIETSYLQPEYFRFLELWHETYPDDVHQYDQSYYSNVLQEKLNDYLSKRQLFTQLPNEQYELLRELSGEKELHPVKMIKLQKQLSKISNSESAFELINRFQLPDTQNNTNYLFLKSLAEIKKFHIINILFAIGTFCFFNFFITPDNHIGTNFLITILLSLIFIFVFQPILNAKILGHSDYEKTLVQYLQYWFLSGFILCSFIPWLSDLLHQLLSYGWFISSIVLLSALLLDATPYMNRLEQSALIHFDTWMINMGLISLSLFFTFFFFIIGEPDHIWLIVYSLIPISFLFFPESFRPLFYIFGYNKENPDLTEKQVIYKSIGIIFFRLAWVFGFSYFLISASSKPFLYAGCLILASVLITGFNAKNLSSTVKYLTYICLFIGTLYSIIVPFVLAYFLYQSYQAKKLIASTR